jgi:hypothetical protein
VFFILVFRERVSRRVGELENERVWGCRNYRGGRSVLAQKQLKSMQKQTLPSITVQTLFLQLIPECFKRLDKS